MDDLYAGVRRRYSWKFVLDEAKLRKIVGILGDFAKKLSPKPSLLFHIERADNSFYDTTELDTVLQDENNIPRQILRLSVALRDNTEASQKRSKPLVELCFDLRSREDANHIVLNIISDDRDWCFLLDDKLENQLKRVKAGRHLSDRLLDLIDPVLTGCLVVLFSIMLLGIGTGPPPPWVDRPLETSTVEEMLRMMMTHQVSVNEWRRVLGWFMIILPLLISFVLLGFFRPVRALLRSTQQSWFYWGDMIISRDRKQKLFSRVAWTIGVGLAICVVGGIIVAWLTRQN